MSEPQRLDIMLVSLGIFKSRETAKRAILASSVKVNGKIQEKPAYSVTESDMIEYVGEPQAYVSRGGLKLKRAIDYFGLSLKGYTCLDAGASTGGFTDCMLQEGAREVYAVEGGRGQLDASLINHPAVHSYEKTDVRAMPREITDVSFDFLASDLSFISLTMVMPYLFPLLKEDGKGVLLVKPEFEAGREAIGKNGVVKNPRDHVRVLNHILSEVRKLNVFPAGLTYSPIKGGSGNIEYLLYLTKRPIDYYPDVKEIVDQAFSIL